MPKTKSFIYREHFKYDAIRKSSICVADKNKCDHVVPGNHLNNLRKHIKNHHPTVYAELESELIENEINSPKDSNPRVQNNIETYGNVVIKSRNLRNVEMSFERIATALLKEIVMSGRPISIVEDEGIRDLINPLLAAMSCVPWAINRQNMTEFMFKKAGEIKQYIKNELKDKMISVKIDGAEYLNRYFVGINVQYRHEFIFQILTIGCIEMDEKTSAKNLAELILKRFELFEVNVNQIYTITSDNGANYVKAIEIVNEKIMETSSSSIITSISQNEENLASFSKESELKKRTSTTSKENLDKQQIITEDSDTDFVLDEIEIEEVDGSDKSDDGNDEGLERKGKLDDHPLFEEDVFENMVNDYFVQPNENFVTGFRCIAHTQQLAIKDWMLTNQLNYCNKNGNPGRKKNNPRNSDNILEDVDVNDSDISDCELEVEHRKNFTALDKLRKNIKKLRVPSMRKELKRVGIKHRLVLQNATRWSSLYGMLHCSLLYKNEIRSVSSIIPKNIKLKKRDWKELENILEVLKPCHFLTMKLQRSDITLGDACLDWKECLLKLRLLGTPLANSMKESMESRELKIFHHPAFLSALYLDPRCKVLLSSENDKKIVTEHLCALYECLLTLNENIDNSLHEMKNNVEATTNNTVENASNSKTYADDDLNKELFEAAQTKRKNLVKLARNSQQTHLNILREKLETYFNEDIFLPKESNIIEFWIKKKKEYPELYKLANIILAVPSSQTSVERLFSTVHFILNPYRNRLSSDKLDDILLLRNNFNIMEQFEF